MSKRPEESAAANERDRMGDFAKRLKEARQEAGLEAKPAEPPPPAGLAAYALRLATELVAGVLVGGLVGYWAFRQLEPSPWAPAAFIGFIGLGAAAGVWNIVRAVKRVNAQLNTGPVPATPDDEDED